MAIFSHSDNPSAAAGGSTTIITDGAAFKGELSLECDLFVDGLFEGTIRSAKTVTIGKNGTVKGELHADHLLVQGVVQGTVEAEYVEIKAGGEVLGTIISTELSIETKGRFEGESKLKSAAAASSSDEA